MAKKKTTTKKSTVTEPVTEAQPEQSVTNTKDTPDTLFDCMKRRREKEH